MLLNRTFANTQHLTAQQNIYRVKGSGRRDELGACFKLECIFSLLLPTVKWSQLPFGNGETIAIVQR